MSTFEANLIKTAASIDNQKHPVHDHQSEQVDPPSSYGQLSTGLMVRMLIAINLNPYHLLDHSKSLKQKLASCVTQTKWNIYTVYTLVLFTTISTIF